MALAEDITRGAMRLLLELGYAPLMEVPLTNKRRVDLVAVGRAGDLIVVEVKSGLADFRSDGKWPEYLGYADRFYFAVADDFPLAVLEEDTSLPGRTGIMIADRFGAEIIREAANHKVNAARRKKLTLDMARLGAQRLTGFSGLARPGLGQAPSSTLSP